MHIPYMSCLNVKTAAHDEVKILFRRNVLNLSLDYLRLGLERLDIQQ